MSSAARVGRPVDSSRGGSARLDTLLLQVRGWRLARFLVQLLLLVGAGILVHEAFARVGDHYLVRVPAVAWLVPLSVLLFLFARCLLLQLRQTEKSIAAELDRKLHLKERLETYLELRGGSHPFLPALAAETESRAASVRAFRAGRMTDHLALPAGLVVFLLVALQILPFLPVPSTVERKLKEQQEARRAAAELAESAKEAVRIGATRPELERLVEDFRKASRNLQRPEADRESVLRELSQLEQKSEQSRKAVASGRKRVLADRLSPRARSASARDLDRVLQEMQDVSGKEVSPEEAARMSGEDLTPEEAQAWKKALEEYRSQARQEEAQLAELQRGLESARKQLVPDRHEVTYNSKLRDRDVEKGRSGADDGPGTTNRDAGPSTFDTSEKKGRYVEDRTRMEYQKLYKGEHVDAGTEPLYVPGELDPDEAEFMRIRDFGSGSRVELKDIPIDRAGQNAAESVITKEKIPASYQRLIKRYFDSISGEEGTAEEGGVE